MKQMTVQADRAGLYLITDQVSQALLELIEKEKKASSGVLHLFNMHTSSALTINESWDPSAQKDLECFLNYLAPENLSFIQHTLEGPDDSPAHMKALLLNQHLALIVENKALVLGRWQGIFLAEFRKLPPKRTILLKYQPD